VERDTHGGMNRGMGIGEGEVAWLRARAGDAIRKMASRGSVPDRVAESGRKRATGRSRVSGEPDAKRRRAGSV